MLYPFDAKIEHLWKLYRMLKPDFKSEKGFVLRNRADYTECVDLIRKISPKKVDYSSSGTVSFSPKTQKKLARAKHNMEKLSPGVEAHRRNWKTSITLAYRESVVYLSILPTVGFAIHNQTMVVVDPLRTNNIERLPDMLKSRRAAVADFISTITPLRYQTFHKVVPTLYQLVNPYSPGVVWFVDKRERYAIPISEVYYDLFLSCAAGEKLSFRIGASGPNIFDPENTRRLSYSILCYIKENGQFRFFGAASLPPPPFLWEILVPKQFTDISIVPKRKG